MLLLWDAMWNTLCSWLTKLAKPTNWNTEHQQPMPHKSLIPSSLGQYSTWLSDWDLFLQEPWRSLWWRGQRERDWEKHYESIIKRWCPPVLLVFLRTTMPYHKEIRFQIPHGNNAYTKQKIDRKKQCSTVFRQSLPSDHFHQDSLKSVDGIPFTPLCRTCRFAEVQASSNAILQIDGLQPHVPCDKKYIQ